MLAHLHLCIHKNHMLPLGCKMSPAWYHAGESSKVLPRVLGGGLSSAGKQLALLSAAAVSEREEGDASLQGVQGQQAPVMLATQSCGSRISPSTASS